MLRAEQDELTEGWPSEAPASEDRALEERASEDRASRPTAPAAASPFLRVGDVLDDTFEIRSLIGSGGMGRVYEARDRVLNRRVAIKVASHAQAWALRREAQALAPLSHPAVPTVHMLGNDHGVEYLVMERIWGHTLEAHIRQRQATNQSFPVRQVLDLLIAMADGLAAIHQANISHRDIKPANVILAPGNRVVLIDFGLFRPEFDTDSGRGICGSPDYMASEIVMNRLARFAGHAVDIYALGVIAFELLTGRTPFESDSLTDVLSGHVASSIPDLSALRSDAPPRLCRLVESMLAKSWDERPQSAEMIAWELRSLGAPAPGVERRGFSVLLVDDDPDMLELMSLVVQKNVPGTEVRSAHGSDDALALCHEKMPDAMLIDLDMPGMNGIELAMYLRGTSVAQHCDLVLVSGKTPSLTEHLLQRLGAVRFIAKGHGLEDELRPVLRELRRRAHASAARR